MMVRRTRLQSKTDDAAFPVRVKFEIPERGFGMRLNDIHRWLLVNLGSGEFAVHSATSLGGGALAVHFREVISAQLSMVNFPELELADGLTSRAYSSPAHDAAWNSLDLLGVCNLYTMTSAQSAIIDLTKVMNDSTGNLPTFPSIFPDQAAPVVRNTDEGRELSMMRWGMPPPAFAMKGKKVERGVTNVRNTASPHWRRWLGVESRCVVPFTSFCEYDTRAGKNREPVWFALDESRPLAFFAGIWTQWTSVRKLVEGETTSELFGFHTTDANADVAPIYPKAMPVILTEPAHVEAWLNDITPDIMFKFRTDYLPIQAGLKPQTVAKHMTLLRGMWKWAIVDKRYLKSKSGKPIRNPWIIAESGTPKKKGSNRTVRTEWLGRYPARHG